MLHFIFFVNIFYCIPCERNKEISLIRSLVQCTLTHVVLHNCFITKIYSRNKNKNVTFMIFLQFLTDLRSNYGDI